MKMKIDLEDIGDFEYLVKLAVASPSDKTLMGRLCTKYDMRGCNICSSCSVQVRRLHQRIIDFYIKNKDVK